MHRMEDVSDQHDVCVIGGGLTGLAAVLFLSNAGLKIAHIAAEHSEADHRTTALLANSVDTLQRAGVSLLDLDAVAR